MYISSAGAAGASKAPSSEPRELTRVDSKAIKVESGRRWWEDFFVFRINRLVGWQFVVATALLYGIDQGGVESLVGLPQVYFYKNRGLSPAETTRVMTYAGLSWSIKPLFGLIMDGFPILRYHFRPYMLLFGILGAASPPRECLKAIASRRHARSDYGRA